MVFGVPSVVIGMLIREACYRPMGRLFTFQIAIRPNHKIIDTGPYGIVRHPSYTGAIFLITGGVFVAIGPQAYIRSCGLMSSSITLKVLAWVWTVYSSYILYSLLRRGPVEDRGLHDHFGKEWENYASRVPYMYIPGVI
ncbi:hypothetical protein M422DRAFT_185621 [Sphaerobolus stellatus SS14]|uniref:Protein-S-isoprenylcysteine O-methyltransferase n=1 Tax=Sphaerobolus stellatus (strain SS14) TaxID=990650 RepID=A0A0C9V287_SPHS4|nr:hypothetical protein M422DRAFT_185621 [Sphaerobolus stellatus SS14]